MLIINLQFIHICIYNTNYIHRVVLKHTMVIITATTLHNTKAFISVGFGLP